MTAQNAFRLLVASVTLGALDGPRVACAADGDADQVIRAVIDHYSRMKSIRVRGVDHYLQSGGLHADDPLAARPVRAVVNDVWEFEHWSAPPKMRFSDKRSRNGKVVGEQVQAYFDGQVYTGLRPAGKRAVVEQGGGEVRPWASSPLHAIGFCYPFTLRGSFADLLSDRSKVTAERLPDHDGSAVWLLAVTPLPEAIQPRDFTEFNRKRSLTRLWVSVTPTVRVLRWAEYERPAYPPIFEGPDPPCFRLDGYNLIHGYVNSDFRPARDDAGGPSVPIPRRVYHGNKVVSAEYTLTEVVINPAVRPDTFRPALPAGFAVQKVGVGVDGVSHVTGGAVGEEIRVEQISQEARDLLGSSESLRAPAPGWREWLLPAGAVLLILAGLVAGVAVVRRKRRVS